MDGLTITILHHIPGRVRIQLSWPPASVENMKSLVMGHAGISSFQYTSITRTVLIYFNPLEITFQEIILRVALALSQEHNLVPVRISGKPATREMSQLVLYSGIFLAAAFIGRILALPLSLQKNLNRAASFSTIGAVLEHAWTEVRVRGNYDPEVLSVVYLAGSMLKGESLSAALLTWVTTFGRHLLRMPAESVMIQAFQVKERDSADSYYDVIISADNYVADRMNFFKFFLTSLARLMTGQGMAAPGGLIGQMHALPQKHSGILEGMGSVRKGILLRRQ